MRRANFYKQTFCQQNSYFAIIVSKSTYAISSWYSFFVIAQIAQINSLFKRAYTYEYVKFIITVKELLASYDDQLFYKATYGNHCLHHLLSVAKSNIHGLRDIRHGLLIDHVTFEMHNRTFLNRISFSSCY